MKRKIWLFIVFSFLAGCFLTTPSPEVISPVPGSDLSLVAARGVYADRPGSPGTTGLLYTRLPAPDADFEPAPSPGPAAPLPSEFPVQPDDAPNDPTPADDTPPAAPGKYIALSFDDGPHRKNTPRLLDILLKYDAKATFFVVGSRVEDNKELITRMAEEGHEVANHSQDHKDLTKLDEESARRQIEAANEIISLYAPAPRLFRPPLGSYNDAVKELCSELGLGVVIWNVDPMDWRYFDAQRVSGHVLTHTGEYDIILMHDMYATSVDAAEIILKEFTEQGYEFVTVSRLIELCGGTVEAGAVYHRVRPG